MKRARIAPVGRKRREAIPARQACREAVYERARGRCEAAPLWPAVGCAGPLDVHEVLTRARGGSITDPENCRLCCRAHHDALHAEPLLAESVGLLRHSWEG